MPANMKYDILVVSPTRFDFRPASQEMSRPSLCTRIALPAIQVVLLSVLAVLLPGIATRPLRAAQNASEPLRARTPADQSAAKENAAVAQFERVVRPVLEARC